MDTRKLLEELENVINSANEVPFTNKKMVDKDEIENLDGEFKAKLQKQQVLNSIKTYIIKNIDMLS